MRCLRTNPESFRSNTETPVSQMAWREIVPPIVMEPMLNEHNSYLRYYQLGECSVVVTREYGRWHLSIAHQQRYPTWDELATARYRAIPPDVWMAMFLPPPSEYINLHPNCFQISETDERTG